MPDYDKQRRKVDPPVISLADLRKALGMTQEKVAEKVAAITDQTFTNASVSAIEKGHRGASAETLAAMEQVFGLQAGALVVTYVPSHDRRKVEAVA